MSMKPNACTDDYHSVIRNDEFLFRCLTITDAKRSVQHDADGFPLLQLGNCKRCGSTISRVLSPEAQARLDAHV